MHMSKKLVTKNMYVPDCISLKTNTPKQFNAFEFIHVKKYSLGICFHHLIKINIPISDPPGDKFLAMIPFDLATWSSEFFAFLS